MNVKAPYAMMMLQSRMTGSRLPHAVLAMCRGNPDCAVQLVTIMVLWAACFPLITLGLSSSPHLTFAAMRSGLAGAALVIGGASWSGKVDSAMAAADRRAWQRLRRAARLGRPRGWTDDSKPT